MNREIVGGVLVAAVAAPPVGFIARRFGGRRA